MKNIKKSYKKWLVVDREVYLKKKKQEGEYAKDRYKNMPEKDRIKLKECKKYQVFGVLHKSYNN